MNVPMSTAPFDSDVRSPMLPAVTAAEGAAAAAPTLEQAHRCGHALNVKTITAVAYCGDHHAAKPLVCGASSASVIDNLGAQFAEHLRVPITADGSKNLCGAALPSLGTEWCQPRRQFAEGGCKYLCGAEEPFLESALGKQLFAEFAKHAEQFPARGKRRRDTTSPDEDESR
jgi:hypothetical protein